MCGNLVAQSFSYQVGIQTAHSSHTFKMVTTISLESQKAVNFEICNTSGVNPAGCWQIQAFYLEKVIKSRTLLNAAASPVTPRDLVNSSFPVSHSSDSHTHVWVTYFCWQHYQVHHFPAPSHLDQSKPLAQYRNKHRRRKPKSGACSQIELITDLHDWSQGSHISSHRQLTLSALCSPARLLWARGQIFK